MIRPALPGDASFVAAAFLQTFRRQPFAGPIPVEMFDDTYRRAFVIAASRPGMRTLIASILTPAGETLVGFATGRAPDVLVYVAVKPDYQRGGIMTALLEALGIDRWRRLRCAYWTEEMNDIRKAGKLRADYRPDIVRRRPKESEWTKQVALAASPTA